MSKRMFRISICLFLPILFVIACKDPTSPPVSDGVSSVSVSPATANVAKGGNQQFAATVAVTGNAAQTVTWAVSGKNSNSTNITTNGLLSVGADETATILTVTATSTVNTTKKGNAIVTVTDLPSGLSVTIAPSEALSVYKYGQIQFYATVSSEEEEEEPPQAVNWSIVTGGLAVGTEITNVGILKVAGAEQNTSLTIRAAVQTDASAYDEVNVTVAAPVVDNISVDGFESADRGTGSHQFSATVTFQDADNIPEAVPREVSWSVARQSGEKQSATVISAVGVLTIAENEAAGVLIITATSVYDPSKTGHKNLTVYEPSVDPVVREVSVNPEQATVLRGATRQFTPQVAVSGTPAPSRDVTWSILGNTSVNTTIVGGLLSVAADESPGAAGTLIITATSVFDTDKSGSATVTVPAPVQIGAPVNVSLSVEGVAAWNAPANETNVSKYTVQLLKGGSAQGDAVDVNKGSAYSYPFLNDMRTAGPGSYTVSVLAVSADAANYSNSAPAVSTTARQVTLRTAVEHTWWYYDYAQWVNTDTTGDYIIQLYKDGAAIGSEIAVARASIPDADSGGTKSEYNSAATKASNGVGLYTFKVMATGNDRLVLDSDWSAVSSGAAGVTGYSPFGDSKVWTIVEGGGRFVVGGDGGKIAWSTDKLHWTLSTQTNFDPASESIRGIAYSSTLNSANGGRFVAVGYGGKIAYSDDRGVSWTVAASNSTDSPFKNPSDNFAALAIAYNGTTFYAVGDDGRIASSANGIAWTWVTGSAGTSPFDDKSILSIAYGDGIFVAVGATGRVAYFGPHTGTDGDGPADPTLQWRWISNNLFATTAGGSNGPDVNSVAFGNGVFVAAGAGGNMKTANAANIQSYGNKWYAWAGVDSKFSDTSIHNVIYGGNQFRAVGDTGKMSVSSDGTTWIAQTVDTQTQFNAREGITAIGFGGGSFILHGYQYDDAPNPNMGKMVVITPQ